MTRYLSFKFKLDLSTIRRPNLEPKRINIDFPTWMVKKLG